MFPPNCEQTYGAVVGVSAWPMAHPNPLFPPKCCRIFGGSIGVNAVAAALTGLAILLITGRRGGLAQFCRLTVFGCTNLPLLAGLGIPGAGLGTISVAVGHVASWGV